MEHWATLGQIKRKCLQIKIFQNISGFKKSFTAKYSLVAMLEKWKCTVDNKKVFTTLLTDLSRAFDCLS